MPDECVQESSETLLLSPELTPSATLKDESGCGKTMHSRKYYKDPSQPQAQYQSQYNQHEQQQQQLKDAENLPLFSRIFVVCNKTTTEDELLQLFSVYGNIENCRLLRDRDTQSSKGLCYIKYSLASSAAKAIEQLNGKHICEHLPPLKVQIAEAKGSRKSPRKQYSDEPEDTPPRSRLFVVCPRDLTEQQLNKEFSRFGDLEYCKVMTDRHSTESKGYSYVKFKLASTAALAMETINEVGRLDGRKVKVLIADPKAKRATDDSISPYLIPSIDDTTIHSPAAGLFNYPLYVYSGGVAYAPPPGAAYGVHPDMPGATQYYIPSPPTVAPHVAPTRNLLYLVCSKRTTQEQLDYLFSSFIEFDYCELKYDKVTGESTGCAFVNFFTPQAAAYAIESLDGTEYPPGSLMKLVWAEPSVYEMSPHMPPMIDAYSGAPPPGAYMSPYQMPYYPSPPALLPYPYAHTPGLVSPSTGIPLPPAAYVKGMMQPPFMSLPPIHPQATTTTAAAILPPPAVSNATPTWIDPSQPTPAMTLSATRLNFSLDITLDRSILLDIFSRFGKIKALELESDRVGYVQFTTPDEATLTLTQLAEVQVNGETIAMQLTAHQPVLINDQIIPSSSSSTTPSSTTDDAVVPPPGTVSCEPVA